MNAPSAVSDACAAAGIEFGADDAGAQDCTSCHGASQRPIFSMYPDCSSFYGSDNDELTNGKVAVQVAELADYRRFLAGAATRNPRYAPLFAPANAARLTRRFPTGPISARTSARLRGRLLSGPAFGWASC